MSANANLYAAIEAAAAAAAETPAFIEGGDVRLRYGALNARVAALAGALREAGVKPGDRVAVQVEKSITAALLYLATLKAGAVFVPLNSSYTSTVVGFFLADATPALLVCDPARAGELAVPAADVPRMLTLGADETGTLVDAAARATPAPTVVCRPHDLAALCYTSGTTGRSKGAMLSHANLASNARTLIDIWYWQPDDVLIHALPIFHVHGLFVALHCALLTATPMRWHNRFDAPAVLADCAQASVLMGVPTFYTRLLALDALDARACAQMRLFISGSAPLLAATHEAFARRTGHRILERYGMTECGMICSNPYDGARVAGTVGYALPGVEVRLRAADGAPVPDGEAGVVEVRGPNVFAGYWGKPETTSAAFRAGGWFITGDIGQLEGDGRLTIVGRASDLIISGGYNVYPREIELLIDAVPGVRESAVIGVPHPDFGEAVVAVVTGTVEEATIRAAITPALARFKQPKAILLVAELPRNAMGKVEKARLRRDHAGLFAALQ